VSTSDAPPNKPGFKRRLWAKLPLVCLIFLLICVGVLFSRIQSKKETLQAEQEAALKTGEPLVNVVTLEALPREMADEINFPGTVIPFMEVTVLAEVRGQVTKRHVDQGVVVNTGDVLVTLDARDYENQLAASKASYQAAVAHKNRIEKLYRKKLATRSRYDDAVAQVNTLKAGMDTATLNVGRGVIRAPMDGVLNRLPVEVGRYLHVGDPVARIIDIDQVKVAVGIPESDVDAVRGIDSFDITVDALGGKVFTGKPYRFSKTADAMARLYPLEILLDNADGQLLPDMFTRVAIVKKRIFDALAVPLYTVITKNDAAYLYVVEEDRAREKRVRLGIQEGWFVQVTEGLAPHDQVIVVGHRGVSEGSPVRVVRTVTDPKEIRP